MKNKLASILLGLILLVSIMAVPACAAEPVFDNTVDLARYVLECANDLDTEFSFSYTAALDDEFADWDDLTDLFANCGLYEWYHSKNTQTRHITISQIEYRMGFRIARLVKMGREDLLTSTEQAVLMDAEWLVEESRMYAPSPFDLLVKLHDAVCYRAEYVYKTTELGSWDTAYGVLGLGQADCDGYADTFYLVASLAGFDVGIQRGRAGGESHIWNVLKWEGQWYHVDTAWDELHYKDAPYLNDYRFLMAGSSLMDEYSWNASLSPYDQAWNTDWDMYYYTTDQTGLTYGAYYENVQDAANYIVYKRAKTGDGHMHVMLKGHDQDGVSFNERLTKAGLTGQWMTWARQVDEYTCFTVLMLE